LRALLPVAAAPPALRRGAGAALVDADGVALALAGRAGAAAACPPVAAFPLLDIALRRASAKALPLFAFAIAIAFPVYQPITSMAALPRPDHFT
jgi:hypothetical protein